jgi:hypothetical protein
MKRKDCIEYDQPDELTARVRREMLLEWTAYVEGMVRSTSDHRAACRFSDEKFQAEMRRLRQDYDAGDKGAVPSIIALCFADERPVPGWAQAEFCNACREINQYRAKSWDDVFGRPLKKGAQLAAARRRLGLRVSVGLAVMERVAAGEAIDKNMFDAIAEELRADRTLDARRGKLKIGGTLVGQVYAECKEILSGEEEWKKNWGADWPHKNKDFRKL